jgi:hypothetical protein
VTLAKRTAGTVLVMVIAIAICGCTPRITEAPTTSPARTTVPPAPLSAVYFEGPASVWAGNADQGTAWDTSIPASVEASEAVKRIARQVPKRGEAFNVVNLREGWRANGDEALAETSKTPSFRIETVAEFATVTSDTADGMWERLARTGEYAVVLTNGELYSGFIARRNRKTGTWEADQESLFSNGFPYLHALQEVKKRSDGFAVKIVVARRAPATSWFVFRLYDGTELASPVFLVPNWTWNAAGAPVGNGDLYPADYVLRPVVED